VVEYCDTWRDWNTHTTHSLKTAVIRRFPAHRVVVVAADDPYFVSCFDLACQIRFFALTDVLIGAHGAGLTNMIFMPPAALVVEIVGKFDGRMLPVCGFYGPLAAAFGLHHYVHYYDSNFSPTNFTSRLMNSKQVAAETLDFYNELRNQRVK
jgi:hypothetical protein